MTCVHTLYVQVSYKSVGTLTSLDVHALQVDMHADKHDACVSILCLQHCYPHSAKHGSGRSQSAGPLKPRLEGEAEDNLVHQHQAFCCVVELSLLLINLPFDVSLRLNSITGSTDCDCDDGP